MDPARLELDLLHTLVSIADLGGFAKAGLRVGRTQSAISLQMRRLEEATGQKLFARRGRQQGLTEAGNTLLRYARRMLALNDEALGALSAVSMAGTVRLGTSQDLAETWLPEVLGEFTSEFPAVRLECRVDRRSLAVQMVKDGELDLALTLDPVFNAPAQRLGEVPLIWIGFPKFMKRRQGPLPLVLRNASWVFEDRAFPALDQAGIPWRVVFTSPSVTGLWPAVRAGLGVTVRTRIGMPSDLSVLPRAWRLPSLGNAYVSLYIAPGGLSNAAARLAAMLEVHIRSRLRARKYV